MSTTERRPTRVRLTLACEDCRARKVRCNGGRPACGACVARRGSRARCLYSSDERHPLAYQRDYVQGLEKRIRELESSQINPHSANSSSISGPDEQRSTNEALHRQTNSSIASTAIRNPPNSTGIVRNVPDISLSSTETRHVLDGMGNIGVGGSEEVGQAMYGNSTTASFMNQIRDFVHAKVRTPGVPQVPHYDGAFQDSLEPYLDAPRVRYSQFSIAKHYVLPPRHVADSMVDYFWIQGHSLYPWLEQEKFRVSYNSLFTGEKAPTDLTLTYCILNVMFAIASQFSDDIAIDSRESAAEVFFKRAIQLLQMEVLGSGSLQLIQALLIIGMYLQSTDTPHRCWVIIGLAIRIAQGLGLHRAETTERIQSQSGRNVARRVWHGCILMDRILSMTLGQPLMIGSVLTKAVPFPDCIDEEYLSSEPGQEGVQPANQPSKLHFYILTLKLYNILEDILTTFYPSGVSDTLIHRRDLDTYKRLQELNFNAILRIDRSLTDWLELVPPYLLAPPISAVAEGIDPVYIRQANVLKLRYLHLQILLFRPVLSQLLSASLGSRSSGVRESGDPLPYNMALSCARKCVLASQQIIDIMQAYTKDDGSFELLPAWWYKVFYVYAAANVVIAARIYRPIHGDISIASLKESWLKSLEILKGHSQVSKSARRCVAALEFLDLHVMHESDHVVPPRLDIASGGGAQGGSGRGEREAALFMQLPAPMPAVFIPELDPLTECTGEDGSAGLGNLLGSMEAQDISWLHSVPMDLLQFDARDMLGGGVEHFYH